MWLYKNKHYIIFVFPGKIEGVLTHYETLHTKDILHGYHKRDASTQEKVVSFTTLGR